MKSCLIFFLLLAACFPSLEGQWEILNQGFENYKSYYDGDIEIDLVSKDAGWLSKGNSLLKTINGGETWNQVPWDLGYIVDCEFIDDSLCWVISERLDYSEPGWSLIIRLYKTNDGGNNWVNMLDMGRSFSSYYAKILCASEDIVVVATRDLMIKSIDGGSSWEDITPTGYEEFAEHLNSVSFTGSDTGVYIKQVNSYSFALARTTDGGSTWEERHLPQFQNIREIGFIDHQTGYLLAQIDRGWPGANNYVICITEDAFSTWTVVTKNQYPIWNFHCFNNQVFLAILEDGKRSKIVKSYNEGRSWIECESPGFFGSGPSSFSFGTSSFSFGNDSIGIIFRKKECLGGEAISILKSTDQGDSWSVLQLSYPLKDVCFLDKQNGLAVGGDFGELCGFGDILRTTNGGRSWNFVHSGPSPIMNCNFVNDSVGFAEIEGFDIQGLYSTNLYQTINGGNNWQVFAHDFYPDTRIKIINEQLGFAINTTGVYVTYTGGRSWDKLLNSDLSRMIYNPYGPMSFVSSDENTFWAIAGNNVLRFTSEGFWELMELETEQSLFRIFFKDENTGWISTGEYLPGWYYSDPPTTFKTEDGGESWFRIDYPYQFRDVCFKDSQIGWAVGMDTIGYGLILETTNGGEDWAVQVDSLSAPLNGIDYKDGNAWAVGENGLILRMHDSTYVSVIERSDALIREDYPVQIYPNPANSILNIETEISGLKTIELLNLKGQVILKKACSGSFHQLDLSSYRKGIYFITIKSKDFVSTKKILKL